MNNLKDKFEQYKVDCNSVREFLEKYHKRGCSDYKVEYYTQELKENGYTFISHHDSYTGEIVSYYGI